MDGRGRSSRLPGALAERLDLDGPEGFVAWAARADKRSLAALTPVVRALAREGDAVAEELLTTAADALVAHISALLAATGPWTEAAGAWLPFAGFFAELHGGSRHAVGVVFAHQIYTAEDAQRVNGTRRDWPYSGHMYFGGYIQREGAWLKLEMIR